MWITFRDAKNARRKRERSINIIAMILNFCEFPYISAEPDLFLLRAISLDIAEKNARNDTLLQFRAARYRAKKSRRVSARARPSVRLKRKKRKGKKTRNCVCTSKTRIAIGYSYANCSRRDTLRRITRCVLHRL